MNGIERGTRFALSAVLGMAAMLTNEIANNIWFDVKVYDRIDRVQNYGEFIALTWLFVALAVAVFVWSFEGILERFAKKEEEFDATNFTSQFDDTW
jgi:hypothetical protein